MEINLKKGQSKPNVIYLKPMCSTRKLLRYNYLSFDIYRWYTKKIDHAH